jgi:plasmid stabilization system protein ParE
VREAILGATESTRAKLLDYLARGDIAGAISMYEVHTGRQAPSWLKNLQVAYSTASQAPGKCQEVARTIHTALSRLGQNPQYVAFRSRGSSDYIIFEVTNGKQAPVSRTGYHVAVKLGEMIHDAYTGPQGLKLSEYLARIHARNELAWEVVSKP